MMIGLSKRGRKKTVYIERNEHQNKWLKGYVFATCVPLDRRANVWVLEIQQCQVFTFRYVSTSHPLLLGLTHFPIHSKIVVIKHNKTFYAVNARCAVSVVYSSNFLRLLLKNNKIAIFIILSFHRSRYISFDIERDVFTSLKDRKASADVFLSFTCCLVSQARYRTL